MVRLSQNGRRVLITGLSTFWGGRVARHLEAAPGVELVVGLDTREPTVALERTEFVKSDIGYSSLQRIVQATQVDTIMHTHLVVDSTSVPSGRIHEINVIGTMNLLAAASSSPSVRKVVVKSSTLVYGSDRRDPYYFREMHVRSGEPQTIVERSLLEAEDYVRDFVHDSPHVVTTILRFANVLGGELETPLTRLLRGRVVPAIFGFDPRLQFVHQEDVIGALEFCVENDVAGIFNVAGDGIVPWSEVLTRAAKPVLQILPVGTETACSLLRQLGIDIPPELQGLLRFGRGADNRRLLAAGFRYRYTSAGALLAHVEESRLRATKGEEPAYRYESDLEEFLRRSPAVVRREA